MEVLSYRGIMNINYIEYSIATKSLDIFFAGCNNRCKNCCNPELMSFENGTDYTMWFSKLDHYLEEYKLLIENVFLVGGSPNHQNEEDMKIFLEGLRKRFKDIKIFLFCGEEMVNVKPVFKEYCDFIKVGAYIPELKTDNNVQYGIKLATSNQKILEKGKDY